MTSDLLRQLLLTAPALNPMSILINQMLTDQIRSIAATTEDRNRRVYHVISH